MVTIFKRRSYRGTSDLAGMIELATAYPDNKLSAAALPYHLSSWAFDEPDNLGLWEDTTGQLQGFALFQVPMRSLYYALQPAARRSGLEDQMFRWAIERSQILANERNEPFSLSVWPAEGNHQTMALLENHAFDRQDAGKIFFTRSLTEPIAALPTPDGFTLRSVQGEKEDAEFVALISAAFNTNNITNEWRRRIIQQPPYMAELDIVIEAPNGQHAAFCLCWLHPDRSTGQIEPMGTHPNYQRLGLGRAAAIEGLRRMQALGAKIAIVGTSTANQASRRLYQSIGFQIDHQKVGFSRMFFPVIE